MLDRYTLTLKPNELALVMGAEVPDGYEPHYNAAPTKSLPIVLSTQPERLVFQKWGLMTSWSNNRTMSSKFFNLPAESVFSKASYKKKLTTHKCVIPMDGFYVWKQVAKKQKVPYYFFFPDKKVFSVAGLWEENDEGEDSFIMITQPSNDQISLFQEDMPAIMDTATTRKWLESDDHDVLQGLLLEQSKQELMSHTVGPGITNLDLNEDFLIKPTPASDQHGNYTLFS